MAPFVSESVGELDQMIDWKDLSTEELIHESDITPSLWPFMNMQNKQLLACSSQKMIFCLQNTWNIVHIVSRSPFLELDSSNLYSLSSHGKVWVGNVSIYKLKISCSVEDEESHRFRTSWRWDDRIFILGELPL